MTDTSPTPVRLQPLTRARVASLGPEAADWAAALPTQLAELAEQWSLALGRTHTGGSSSYVVNARTVDGTPVVVKAALPEPGLEDQVRTLRQAEGRGYVRLLDYDAGRHALLLEALGDSLQQSARPVADQLRLLANTLAVAWQPAELHPAGPSDKASSLAELLARLWVKLDRPCPEPVVAQALAYAERRRHVDPAELVVVHGDPHPGNLLAVPEPRPGAETGWCFVDPDGFVADRAYDLGVVLRGWTARLDGPDPRGELERYCAVLAEHSGVDATRIWEWGFLERVSSGLHILQIGAPRVAAPYLQTAGLLLD